MDVSLPQAWIDLVIETAKQYSFDIVEYTLSKKPSYRRHVIFFLRCPRETEFEEQVYVDNIINNALEHVIGEEKAIGYGGRLYVTAEVKWFGEVERLEGQGYEVRLIFTRIE